MSHTYSDGNNVWDVAELWKAAATLPVKRIPISTLDANVWTQSNRGITVREIIQHCQRIQEADLSYPIILSASGAVMDGVHRIAHALLLAQSTTIQAVQFEVDPPPTRSMTQYLKPMILYRRDPDIKDFDNELSAMRKYFDVTSSRNDNALYDSLVIGRYSVLPYYKELCEDLEFHGARMINSLQQHIYIADVMCWAAHELEGITPRTWDDREFHTLPDDGTSFVLKGHTNSHKFLWDTHMFAKDKQAAIQVFCRLQDDRMISTQRIYAREYIPLKTHFISLHGLPITEEFRFFVCYGKILSGGYYWSNFTDEFEEGAPSPDNVPQEFLQDVISRIGDNACFYALDVAQTQDGRWIVIELNDASMSGLSNNDPWVLYRNLKNVLESGTNQPSLRRL